MLSKKLLVPLAVLAATALMPVAGAHASPQTATSAHSAMQAGPEDIPTAKADGSIAITGDHHICLSCPHPPLGTIVPKLSEGPNTVL